MKQSAMQNSPFPSYWRQAIEAGYRHALLKQDNVSGAKTVLQDAGYTSEDISALTLKATMAQPDLSASQVQGLTQDILGHKDDTDCACGACSPKTISPVDDCTTFKPLTAQ